MTATKAPSSAAGSGGRRVLSFADGWGRRAQQLRRKRSHRVLWGAGIALLGLVVAWVVLGSTVFGVAKLEISGTSAPVRAVANRMASTERGRSVLLVDTGALEERIEKDSRVADATVRRGLPRSLVIEVTARIPVLGLENTKGEVELLDISGVRIETVSKAPAGVPVVKGGAGVADASGVRASLEVMSVLPEALRARVRDLRFDATGSVSFRIAGTDIVWGPPERPELKSRLVQILLTKKPQSIDVSAPDTPVTT
ncbi:MAG: FtsQ-type POTRA domain-containing protein [Nostocoides sp.]|uniref:cell division protein FtsQ/DivIB n=1 Tax=Nostocoides sp. TaxID=1917966 RepID=UPI003BCEBAE7